VWNDTTEQEHEATLDEIHHCAEMAQNREAMQVSVDEPQPPPPAAPLVESHFLRPWVPESPWLAVIDGANVGQRYTYSQPGVTHPEQQYLSMRGVLECVTYCRRRGWVPRVVLMDHIWRHPIAGSPEPEFDQRVKVIAACVAVAAVRCCSCCC